VNSFLYPINGPRYSRMAPGRAAFAGLAEGGET